MSGEGVLITGSESLDSLIVDSDETVHDTDPIVVVFDDVNDLVFSGVDHRDIKVSDSAWWELGQRIGVPVGAVPGDDCTSIEVPEIGNCGVLGVVPKVLSEGDTGQPVIRVGISIDVVLA